METISICFYFPWSQRFQKLIFFFTGSEGFNLYKRKDESLEEVMSIRRKHMQRHYDDLTNCYFSNRVQKVLFPPETAQTPDEDNEGFYEFSSSLNNFTRYSGLRHLATLSYTTDMFNNASIVSSIEFDKNQEMFAIGKKHYYCNNHLAAFRCTCSNITLVVQFHKILCCTILKKYFL